MLADLKNRGALEHSDFFFFTLSLYIFNFNTFLENVLTSDRGVLSAGLYYLKIAR